LYRENRARFPVEELRRHAGQWVAFSADGRRLVAAGEDYARLEQLLSDAGQDPQECVFEQLPGGDTCFGGAELL
jgi:hypothetical protein